MSYEQRIMNIPAKWDGPRGPDATAYLEGHRDARHAAAEIVLEADAEITRLRAENERLREALSSIVKEADNPMGCIIDGNEMGNFARAALSGKEG